MDSALAVHQLHFAFTVTFHYLFPQLTMGLALLILILKTMALWTNDERYNLSARFWAKIFAVNFAFGVITGIPMEFQFGTNWASFSREAGSVIGQTLGMEGQFPRAVLIWRKKAHAALALGLRVPGFSRIVAVRILDHRYRCLDAASYRLRNRPGRPCVAEKFHRPVVQSLGRLAVFAQHVRFGGDGELRDGRHRRVLHTDAPA
jgi:hypothetical protein